MHTPELPIVIPPADTEHDYIDSFFTERDVVERSSESAEMANHLWQLALTTTFTHPDTTHQYVLDSINSGKVSYEADRSGAPVTMWLECFSPHTAEAVVRPSTVTLYAEGTVDGKVVNFPMYDFTPTDVFRFDHHQYSPKEMWEVNSADELAYLEGVLLSIMGALDEAEKDLKTAEELTTEVLICKIGELTSKP